MTPFQKLPLLCGLLLAGSVSAQIKVFTGGKTIIGTTNAPLYGATLQVTGPVFFTPTTSGSTPLSAAYIRSLSTWSTDSTADYTWWGDDHTGIFHPAANTVAITCSRSEKFRFNSSGQILSGNSSSSASTPEFSWKSDPNTGMYRPGTDVLGFVTNGSERLRITPGGLVGIETTSPASTLSVGGNGNSLYKGYFYSSSTSNGSTAGYFSIATPTGTNRSYAAQGIVTCGTGYAYGLFGSSYNSTTQITGQAIGVFGQAGNATTSYNFGVAGVLLGINNGAGVYGSDRTTAGLTSCGDNYAGFFAGKLRTTDDLPTKPSAGSWVGISDMRLKRDTASFKDGLDVIRKVKPVTYKYKDMGGLPADKTYIGVIAQEIQKIAPYCVGTTRLVIKQSEAGEFEQVEQLAGDTLNEPQSIVNVLSYNYDALIYVLINSVKQLDAAIASMKDGSVKQTAGTERSQQVQQQLDELKELVNACCQQKNSSLSATASISGATDGSWLAQNKPNPFNKETTIDYNVVKEGKASILVFDMSGKLLKTIPVKIPGRGSVTISANDFQAGMYYYSLVVNDEEVDTKKMILTE